MILTGGTIRTLDPQLATARALAIAGEWIAGGVGVHETALASPETIDLGGRCVLPGFNDSHVHFPTWAVAQGQVRLESAHTLE
ncbi:MAG: amidohydrolase, partial [Thermoleophilia bacterium]